MDLRMDKLNREYENFLADDEKKLSEIKGSIHRLTILRLAAFVGIILSFIYLHNPLNYGASILLLALFFYWVKRFIEKEKEKKLHARLVKINRDELLALNEIYEHFDEGDEFINPHHAYSFDLDLYGEGSLFQFMNRTTTQLGKKKLASFLNNPTQDKEQLMARQEAINELAELTRWRQLFAAKGQTQDEQDFTLLQLLSEHESLPQRRTIKWLIFIFPSLTLCLLCLFVFGVLPWGILLISLFANVLILVSFGKTIKSFYQLFGNQSKILDKYKKLLQQIEQTEFESDLINNLKQKLSCKNKQASSAVEQLQNTMARFDYRANVLFMLIAEPIFLWDLICTYQLDLWHQRYHNKIEQWFDVIAEIDALSSLANLNYTHPDWSTPTFTNDEFQLSAKELSHPLIKLSKRIGNDFNMTGKGKISIITGANMAGKSTFLRTIGVNMVLAMNGCRVCATHFSLNPIGLYTNMRTTDNLQKDESYFFAELLRLQQMLTLIKEGKPLFIIVDEMLKGTNSTDKLNGSKALVEQLIKLNANGLVATHDLKLTEMATKFPEQITNQCFDVKLGADDLIFDYKLLDGVTSTMNASFLMKKMGIIE